METYLQMCHITKSFPGVRALNDVSLDVYPGEVLALMGENGAGKSTLVKVLTGVYRPDKNPDTKILIDGRAVEIESPSHARQCGISIIYQELATVDNLTVSANIFLAREPLNKFGMIDEKQMCQQARELLASLHMDIDVRQSVASLSVGQQMMVEIAKAISYQAKIIVMDEPTASLSHKETQTLMNLLRDLKQRGIGIIYISHRLEEVFEIADRVTVLRDGSWVDTLPMAEVTREILVKKMVDRDLSDIYERCDCCATDEVVLAVKGLENIRKKNEVGGIQLRDISFELRKGEILGFSGLVGSGRTEIMELLFGKHPYRGEIVLQGQKVKIKSPRAAIDLGIGFVTENRKELGLVLQMSVRENVTLASLKKVSNAGFVSASQEGLRCQKQIESLGIKTPGMEQCVVNLSGGNQQKVVLAKWLENAPKVLIVDEPTRGIDIGAKSEVHSLLAQLAAQGVGIIMISSELPEVLAMSDRIVVLREGRITGRFTREEAVQEKIMACAFEDKAAAQHAAGA